MEQHNIYTGNPKLITCAGYGGTGSSAITNILEEFTCIKSLTNQEYNFLFQPDGIADLEYFLIEGNGLKIDLAIKRFQQLMGNLAKIELYKNRFNGKFKHLYQELLNSIIKCEWSNGWLPRGFETMESSLLKEFRNNLTKIVYDFYLENKKYAGYEPDGWRPSFRPHMKQYYSNISNDVEYTYFIQKVNKFTAALLNEENTNGQYRYIFMDQALPSMSISKYLRYFDSPKLIIVDRDPRDLYVLNKAIWGCGFLPTESPEIFISWYKATRNLRKTEISINNGACLFINFESLIFNYDDSLRKIMNYASLSEDEHLYKLRHFNPELSITNTQKFLNYPELFYDIEKIERDLPEYCFEFPKKQSTVLTNTFLIENVNPLVNYTQNTGKIHKNLKKNIFFLFRMTRFYQNKKFLKKRKGFGLIKILIKLAILLFISPFELIKYMVLYIFLQFMPEQRSQNLL